jgi:5-methylcytosine-specific restriction endonuclease McrA
MSSFSKKASSPLAEDEHLALRRQVLRRDRWRCQGCGSTSNLEIHHQQFRSHGGLDVLDNLITLCRSCHEVTHQRRSE